jgi:hypothetical protein
MPVFMRADAARYVACSSHEDTPVDLRTPRERQRDRLMITFGAMLIVGAVAFGLLFIMARTTDVFVEVPTPTPTVVPTATVNPDTVPLDLVELQFTPRVAYGGTLVVEIFTEPGTQCQIRATVFSLSAGNYQNVVLADMVTDSSGVCDGQLPITESVATGEHTVSITLHNGARTRQEHWVFEVAP